MNQTLRVLLISLTSAIGVELGAQQQASTLFALARSADAIYVATATAISDPAPDWHRVEFRVDDAMKGASRASFAVLEPAGRCCGAALLDAEPGLQFVVFLQARGTALHPIAGDRGLVRATPAIVAHIRETLAIAGQADQETRLLARGLSNPEPRVAQDAALALAAHPSTVRDPEARRAVAEALDRCVEQPTTALPALATTVARAEGPDAALALVPRYLHARSEEAANSLRYALESVPCDQVAAAVRSETTQEESACIRAAELLEQRADPSQLDVLQRLLRDAGTPRAKAHVVSALLEHGVDAKTLSSQVHKSVLAAAIARHQQMSRRSQPFASPPR
jgi:hypothetical protein